MAKQILYTSDLTRKKNLSLYTIFVINPELYQPDIDELVLNKGRTAFYLEGDVEAITKHALSRALSEPTKVADDLGRTSLLNRLVSGKSIYIVLAQFDVPASPTSPLYCNPVDLKPKDPEYDSAAKTVVVSLTDKTYSESFDTYRVDKFTALVSDNGQLDIKEVKLTKIDDDDDIVDN